MHTGRSWPCPVERAPPWKHCPNWMKPLGASDHQSMQSTPVTVWHQTWSWSS
jgi:hypothetical protein